MNLVAILVKENFYFFDICRKMLIPDLPFSADIYAQVAREIFGNWEFLSYFKG